MSGHTPTPWAPCQHLKGPAEDAACKCGYRGGVWGNSGQTLVLEMGTDPYHEGWEMIPVADRPTQLADAAFIVKAVNLHDELVDALRPMAEALARLESRGGKINGNRLLSIHGITVNDARRAYAILAKAAPPTLAERERK